MQSVSTIAQVFEERLLVVPDYQRGYAWESPQIDDFLDDVELLAEDGVHYTGTLVLHPQPDPVRMDVYGGQHHVVHVVDGQQRLTTVVLFLAAMRAALPGTKAELAAGIQRRFLWTESEDGASLFKLRLGTGVQDYWEGRILADVPAAVGPTIRAHERLEEAKVQLTDWVQARRDADPEGFDAWWLATYRKVTQQLKVSVYLVEGMADVGVIFEVMNNRGRGLSELEKTKNHLLYVAAKLQITEVGRAELAARVNQVWSNILQRLMAAGIHGASDEDQLLRTHWLVAYDPDVRRWDKSRSIQALLSLKRFRGRDRELRGAVEDYLLSLDDVSVAFCDANAPNQPSAFRGFSDVEIRRQVGRWSDKLLRIRVMAPFLPLLVAVRRQAQDPRDYLAILQACERFAFRVYRVENRPSHTGHTWLRRLARRIWTAEISMSVALLEMAQMLSRYSKEEAFHNQFDPEGEDWDWYAWRGVRYLLFEYEEYLVGDKPLGVSWWEIVKRSKQETIEHILPQTPTHAYWRSRFTAAQRARLTHDLGNLVLTRDNSAYSNKPFPEKRGDPASSRPCYHRSDLQQERDVAAVQDWTPAAIEARRDRIFAWARERWKAPEEQEIHEPMVTESEDAREDAGSVERRTWSWEDLADFLGTSDLGQVRLTLPVHRHTIEAVPVNSGRGRRNLRLCAPWDHDVRVAARQCLADGNTTDPAWMARLLASMERGEGVAMSSLTWLLQQLYADGTKQPDWQTPAQHWVLKDDGRTLAKVDAAVKAQGGGH